MEYSTLLELVKSRRSVRKWKPDPVPADTLMRAIEAASWSPNSGGRQPYHCYVITNRDKIAAIGCAVQEVTDYLADLCDEEADKPMVERWRQNSCFFAKAPALIAVSAGIYQSVADKLQVCHMDDLKVAEINRCRQIASSRVQTVGCFVDHLLLALHTLGLGAVYMAGPVQAKTAVEKIIGMSSDEDFVALVPVGYADEAPIAPARKPLKDMVTLIS